MQARKRKYHIGDASTIEQNFFDIFALANNLYILTYSLKSFVVIRTLFNLLYAAVLECIFSICTPILKIDTSARQIARFLS